VSADSSDPEQEYAGLRYLLLNGVLACFRSDDTCEEVEVPVPPRNRIVIEQIRRSFKKIGILQNAEREELFDDIADDRIDRCGASLVFSKSNGTQWLPPVQFLQYIKYNP